MTSSMWFLIRVPDFIWQFIKAVWRACLVWSSIILTRLYIISDALSIFWYLCCNILFIDARIFVTTRAVRPRQGFEKKHLFLLDLFKSNFFLYIWIYIHNYICKCVQLYIYVYIYNDHIKVLHFNNVTPLLAYLFIFHELWMCAWIGIFPVK